MKNINLSKYVTGIFVFAFIAVFTSQTLVDLADFLIVVSALFFAYKKHEFKRFFKNFEPVVLWPVWLGIIILGLITNLGLLNTQTWISFIEFKWILTLLSMIYFAKKFKNPSEFLKIISYPILIMNLISLFLFFYRENETRAAGIFNSVMAFSHNIAPLFSMFIVLLLVNWIYYNRNEKFLVGFVAITSGLLTLLTYTRGVWIGATLATVICLFFWNFRRAIQFLCALILVCGTLFLTNQSINDRVLSKTGAETSSNQARLALWHANWKMVYDYPILGVGFGQNKNHLPRYYAQLGYPAKTLVSHAHNQYLQVWAGTGSLGFVCYLIFLLIIFRTIWLGYKNSFHENKALLLGIMAALLCFIIGALTEANFNISKNRFFFLLLTGLAMGLADKKFLSKSQIVS